MDLSAVGYLIWGSSCWLCFLLLCCCADGFLSRSFRVYLFCQTVCAILWLSRHFSSSQNPWLQWAFWQILILAGCAYVAIGVWLAVGVFGDSCRSTTQQWNYVQQGVGFGWLVAAAASLGLLVLNLTGDDKSDYFAIVVFVFYCPAAALAWIDVVAVWWKEWPHPASTSTLGCAVSATNIRRIAVVAATVGMLNFLLPAFEYLGLPLWESTFWTHLLDSVVYLPGILPWIVWIDRKHEEETSSTQEEGKIAQEGTEAAGLSSTLPK